MRPLGARARFTLDGGPQLENDLERTCARIAAGIGGLVPRRRIEAVLLGGGYGRGEGGVLRTEAGERPYNDLEFYVFLRGNRHVNAWRFGRALHVLGEILTPQAGVDVEFKIASRAEFEAGPVSMFTYDLLTGHQQFAGAAHVLAGCVHHRDATRIPVSEATRLLMNRCSGLLLARERLARESFTPADADFVRRNIAKLELALGDAVLVAFGQYHWSVRQRHEHLAELVPPQPLPWLTAVRRAHAAGVEFKLHPHRSAASRGELQGLHAQAAALAESVWLWVEQERLGHAFRTVREYACGCVEKCPELAGARAMLVNIKARGRRALCAPASLRRHPRNRILNALPLLLWEPTALAEPAARQHLQEELETDAVTLGGMMDAYRGLWPQVQ